jgi:hypothetical protein
MTFPDATYKHHKPQNKKPTQNKPSQNANSTAFLLSDNKTGANEFTFGMR